MTEPQEPNSNKPEKSELTRGRFGRSGLRELETLQRTLAEARESTDPDHENIVKIAEKKIELFMYEHDSAGAFKLKRFAREMLATMDESSVERLPDGRLAFSGKEKESRLLFVNMGELDRFNKEGGSHSSGDKALIETVRAIETALEARVSEAAKNGKQASYSIYRYAGNEYAVRVNGISETEFDALMSEVQSAEPRVEGVEEPAPIVVEGFKMSEVFDILNDVESPIPEDERVGPDDRNQLTRSFIDIMRRRAEYSLDVDKFHKRVNRVLQKIATSDRVTAKAFFDNYLAKGFKGVGLDGKDLTFDDFVALSEQQATERFASTHEIDELALKNASKELKLTTLERDATSAVVASLSIGRKRRVSLRPASYENDPNIRIAEIPKSLTGHGAMAERITAYETAISDGLSPSQIEVARLEMEIEQARRDGSSAEGKFTGTGLLDRGSYYERLGQAFETKDSAPRTTVFIDMGFLKYFDICGGRDVGNEALRLGASLMERASAVSGVKAEVFRYGGDEFTVIIEGGDKQTDDYLSALNLLKDEAGAVATGSLGADNGYLPTELSFNYGVADTETAEKAYADLVARGVITDDEDVSNRKAELMTLIADKAIEEQKASDRMELLVRKMLDAKQKGDKKALSHVDSLIHYSKKAIRSEHGGEAFVRDLVDRPDMPPPGEDRVKWIQSHIAEWLSRTPEASADKGEFKRDRLIDALVENYGRTAYYERKYRQERERNEQLDDQNHALRKKITVLQTDREKILATISTLGKTSA